MERLTRPNINVDPDTDRFMHAAIGGKEIDWKQRRDSTLNVLINGPTSNGFGKDIFRKMARDLYGRLKAYEDTGLSPQACAEAREAGKVLSSCDISFGRLAELLTADKDGRLVVLPCKLGTKVYRIRYEIADYPDEPDLEIADTWFTPEYREDIGKTVFLTREEAERALQEMEGKKDG
nr:MAG: hypothetical protein [Bacteriophage sp.]